MSLTTTSKISSSSTDKTLLERKKNAALQNILDEYERLNVKLSECEYNIVKLEMLSPKESSPFIKKEIDKLKEERIAIDLQRSRVEYAYNDLKKKFALIKPLN